MKIGNREVVYNQSFIASKDEMIEIEFMVDNQLINIAFQFVEGNSQDPVTWKADGTKLIMTFSNWAVRSGAFAGSLKKPFKIGVINNIPFGFQVSCIVSVDVYIGNIIFMSGGIYDE